MPEKHVKTSSDKRSDEVKGIEKVKYIGALDHSATIYEVVDEEIRTLASRMNLFPGKLFQTDPRN